MLPDLPLPEHFPSCASDHISYLSNVSQGWFGHFGILYPVLRSLPELKVSPLPWPVRV
jgi:hypothetical protein